MKKFLDEDFLLSNHTAQELYHGYAAGMPIIDYHCHLSPQLIANDHQFRNLSEVWLSGDHYINKSINWDLYSIFVNAKKRWSLQKCISTGNN